MFRWILNLANRLVTLAVALAILACGAYSGFALWDNRQVYAEAEHVQQEILTLKPRKAEGEQAEAQAPSFAQLLAINPDVCAWIEMEGTAIDHPVLQGEDNLAISTRMSMEISRWRAASFWTAATSGIFRTAYRFCTVTTWKTTPCSGIWIYTRTRNFFNSTARAR